MRRRQYLARFATLSTVAVAGCAGDEPDPDDDPGANGDDDPPEDGPDDTHENDDDSDDDEPEETPTGIHEVSDVAAALGERLADEGIDVDYLDVEGSWVVLEYYTDAEAPEELDSDATTVALAYAAYIDDFEDVEGMEAWAMGSDGGLLGRFHIESGWAQAFADGDSTENGYLAEVHGTIQA